MAGIAVEVLGTVLGDGQARLPIIETYEPWQMAKWLSPLVLVIPGGKPLRMKDLILPPATRPTNCYVDTWGGTWTFVRRPGAPTDGLTPAMEGYLYGDGRRHAVWRDDGCSWTVKASGETPKRSGGAFYFCTETGRVYILCADDTWRLQGIPTALLERWRANPRANPAASDELVRRTAGNAITAGTARFIAREVLIGRPRRWAARVSRSYAWIATLRIIFQPSVAIIFPSTLTLRLDYVL